MSINSSRLLTAPPVTHHSTPIHLKRAACDFFVVFFFVPFSENQPLPQSVGLCSVSTDPTPALHYHRIDRLLNANLLIFNLHVLLLFLVSIALFVVYSLLLACVSILHIRLCCCACRPPLISTEVLTQMYSCLFCLSFRSLTIGRAPCSDVSDEHTVEATGSRLHSREGLF